ncbi:hypothetical protein OS189_00350 [Sulfitobacter sp. F26169L]|uniref:hypothetical protein n=1 Tax=Sulfitobacter sp. F26169L TaxID=2996015 RepID=UPI002260F07B|nr:hypothetical protein [Sulfitobacter sp. F26169L]MCX7564789.1 hypothetical protein [Sulfitobacter sp. F26169L]
MHWKQLNAYEPAIRVVLKTSHTRALEDIFAKGECDVILTIETPMLAGGTTLAERPLHWTGAQGGAADQHCL